MLLIGFFEGLRTVVLNDQRVQLIRYLQTTVNHGRRHLGCPSLDFFPSSRLEAQAQLHYCALQDRFIFLHFFSAFENDFDIYKRKYRE